MSAKGKLATYAGFGLLILALIYETERSGLFSIPSDIRNPMNIATLLLLALLISLAALHLWNDDDGD